MPPLPFYSLGQSKYICTRIFKPQLELKQNVVKTTLIEREKLWIKPYIRLIKIESHFSGTHFDNKFATFGVASCIMVAAPISGLQNSLLKSYLWFSYGVKTV